MTENKKTIREILQPLFDKSISKNREEILAEAVRQNPELIYKSASRVWFRYFKNKVNGVPQKETQKKIKKEINIQVEKDKPKYVVVDDKYKIESMKGLIVLSVEQADKMFYDFSVHGLNLSSTQLINKYQIEVWQWHSIKNALRLYKQSNIFSPYSYGKLTLEEKENVITSKISEALNDKINIEKIYNSAVIKEYKRKIAEENKSTLYQQAMLSGLFDELPKIKVENYTQKKVKTNNDIENINVFIADLHNGSKIESLHLTEDYSPEILREKLMFASNQINKIGAKKVTLSFMGDLIESFTGLNHLNSWKEMEYGMHGAKLVRHTVEILIEFISNINNVVKINAVAGNHDRGDSNSKIEYKGEIAGIIFYWLQNVLTIPIEFDFECVSSNIDGIQYVIMHGHHKEATESSEKIILNYGKQGCYNLIVTAHLHTLKVKSDTFNFRHVVCPSIFTGNTYSERKGWTGSSGVMVAYNNGTNKASLNIISI